VTGRQTAVQSLCVQAVGSGLSSLAALISDERIRGVCTLQCTIQIDNFILLYFTYPFPNGIFRGPARSDSGKPVS